MTTAATAGKDISLAELVWRTVVGRWPWPARFPPKSAMEMWMSEIALYRDSAAMLT